jgi:hypothetical protein
MQVKIVNYTGTPVTITATEKILIQVTYSQAFEIHDSVANNDVVVFNTIETPFDNTISVILDASTYVVQPIAS